MLDTPTDKFLMSAMNFAAEMERDKARQRVSEAMSRKAKQGYVTGGRCFGYDNVIVHDAAGRKSHTARTINDAEAVVVREIFQSCADGHGLKAIAKALNARGARAPKPSQLGMPTGWTPSSVRSVLYRRTYLGEIRYGQTKKRDAWGQRRTTKRPLGEVIIVQQPAWRIISGELWAAAHARLDASAHTYRKAIVQNLRGRPATGLVGAYLLSGLTRCALCGGNLIAHCTSQNGRRWRYYTCSSYHNRGRSICPNSLPAVMDLADAAVLNEFGHLLTSDIVEGAIHDALAELRNPEAANKTAATLKAELRRVVAELDRLAKAIATAGDIDSLARLAQEKERRRIEISDELNQLERASTVNTSDAARIEKALRAKMQDWQNMFRRQTPLTRQLLMMLLDGKRLTFTPNLDERSYTFEGVAVLGNLMTGIVPNAETLPVKSQDNGNRSSSLLLPQERRRDDEDGAGQAGSLAP